MEADVAGNTIWHLQSGPGWPGTNDGDPVTAGGLIYRAEKVRSLIVQTDGDHDGDSDLDLADLAALQVAWSGPGPVFLEFPASLMDHDVDGDVDEDDLNSFAYWMTGPAK